MAYFGAGTKLTVLVKVLQQYNIWLNAQIITLSEFLSALLNTVSSQSEAYFGAGTKLTVLVYVRKEHNEFTAFSAERWKSFFCKPCISVNNYDPAYFGSGTRLTVLETGLTITPPTVKVLPPSKKECRNQKDTNQRKKTLVCVASGFYPDHVSVEWKVGGENITKGVATDNAALRDQTTYSITSRLRVPAEEWFNPNNEFTCIVKFYNGTHNEPFYGKIEGVEAEGDGMTREKYLKATQRLKLSYGVFIAKSCVYGAFVVFLVWKLQGKHNK